MSETRDAAEDTGGDTIRPEDIGPPRGTLVIVTVFAVLFGLAWLAMYVFLFLQRGTPHA